MTNPDSAMEAATEINHVNELRGHVLRSGKPGVWDHVMPTKEMAEIISRHQSKEREELLGALRDLLVASRNVRPGHVYEAQEQAESLLSRYRAGRRERRNENAE